MRAWRREVMCQQYEGECVQYEGMEEGGDVPTI